MKTDSWSKASIPAFKPSRPVGPHLEESMTRGARRNYQGPLVI